MNMIVREARLDDIEAIVPFIIMASGGLSDFLLHEQVMGMSVEDLIEMALTDENTTYHFQHMLVAEHHKKIIGASNYYPAHLHGLPDIMRSHISKEKLTLIEPYFNSRVPDSLYVHTLAVAPEYRHTCCGFILGKKLERIAQQQQQKCLSAHVWKDNTLVVQGLKMAGYKRVEDLDIPFHPELQHQGGMVLLKGPDFS